MPSRDTLKRIEALETERNITEKPPLVIFLQIVGAVKDDNGRVRVKERPVLAWRPQVPLLRGQDILFAPTDDESEEPIVSVARHIRNRLHGPSRNGFIFSSVDADRVAELDGAHIIPPCPVGSSSSEHADFHLDRILSALPAEEA